MDGDSLPGILQEKSPPHVQICSPYCCELLAGKGCKDAWTKPRTDAI